MIEPITALIGIVMVWGLSHFYFKYNLKFLDFMKGKTYCIYLLHAVVGAGVGTVLKFSGVSFYVYFVITFITSCFGPIIFIELLRRAKVDDKKIVKILFGI